MESSNLISKEKEEKNKINSIVKLANIKSKYILKKIFNNLNKKNLLKIIKYNKNIKKRIDLNINEYKEYSEKFSSIEIEIKPLNYKFGKFINIKPQDKNYFHIYFNNNMKEIERNYINEDEEIKIIKVIIGYQIESLEGLFQSCDCIESINFKIFNRNNINNMGYMFHRCSSLKELDLSNFITDNVKDMSYMFRDCKSL